MLDSQDAPAGPLVDLHRWFDEKERKKEREREKEEEEERKESPELCNTDIYS